jgi:hypothetical protein
LNKRRADLASINTDKIRSLFNACLSALEQSIADGSGPAHDRLAYDIVKLLLPIERANDGIGPETPQGVIHKAAGYECEDFLGPKLEDETKVLIKYADKLL